MFLCCQRLWAKKPVQPFFKEFYGGVDDPNLIPSELCPIFKYPGNEREYEQMCESLMLECEKHGIAVDDAGKIKVLLFKRFGVAFGGWKRTRTPKLGFGITVQLTGR